MELVTPKELNGLKFITSIEQYVPTGIYQKLVKSIYSGIYIVFIHNVDNSKVYIAPFQIKEDGYLPMSAIIANGMQIMETGKKLGEIEVNAITENFWTCGCKSNFVHHKIKSKCDKCEKDLTNCERRLPYLDNLIKWELYVQ